MARLAAIILLLLTFGCTHDRPVSAAEPRDTGEVRTIAVPARTEGTAIVARVQVGPLPRGARVIVRLGGGEVVGSIAPYGMQAAASGGSYTIPLPDRVAEDESVQLRFEIHEDDAAPRPPRAGEIAAVELLAAPVKR